MVPLKTGNGTKTAKGLSLEDLLSAVTSGKIEWNRHALERMAERNIGREEVLEVLRNGERIEDYPEDRPLPSALFLGNSESRPLHVVVAFNWKLIKALVITVYEPDKDHFASDLKTRKKQ